MLLLRYFINTIHNINVWLSLARYLYYILYRLYTCINVSHTHICTLTYTHKHTHTHTHARARIPILVTHTCVRCGYLAHTRVCTSQQMFVGLRPATWELYNCHMSHPLAKRKGSTRELRYVYFRFTRGAIIPEPLNRNYRTADICYEMLRHYSIL